MANQEVTVHNAAAMKAWAKAWASSLKTGDVLGLKGELGSGKTTFVQGLAEGLKIQKGYVVQSPTFTLVNVYPCEQVTLVHMDFYRCDSVRQSDLLELEEYIHEPSNLIVIEWFDKIPEVMPKKYIEIQFEVTGEHSRKMTWGIY